MYICICNGITEREIRSCAEEGACSLRELEACLGVGSGCGRCKHEARRVLKEVRAEPRADLAASPA